MATQGTSTAAGGGGELYAPELTLGEARARLFALGGLGEDGGYGADWVWLKMWRIPFAFPNTDGRRRAVKFHDLHHVLTGYPTTWRGEFEIAAWEVAAGGINRYWEGWALDLLGFACGLAAYPRSVYRAFMRGRRSSPTWRDRAAFVFWAGASAAAYFATGALLLAPLVALAALVALWWLYAGT